MEKEVIQALEQAIASHVWDVIILFILSFVSIGLIKQLATNIFEFILLKTDVFGRGSLIYYNGKKARIKKIGLRRTKLHMIETDEIICTRTVNWRKFELIDSENISSSEN